MYFAHVKTKFFPIDFSPASVKGFVRQDFVSRGGCSCFLRIVEHEEFLSDVVSLNH